MNTLSPQSLKIIQNYLHLPFPNKNVQTPYFNNRRIKIRGGLRALIGKGSPEDIVEEATIISLREKIDLQKLSNEELKKFLVDNKLGIDCSGLVYHILDAQMKTEGRGSLQQVLKRPWFKNPIRKLLVKLRPIENTGVGTFNHEVNSFEIPLKDIQPGDLIIIMGAGPKQDYNHILLVTAFIPSVSGANARNLSESADSGLQNSTVPPGSNASKDSSSSREGLLGMIRFIHSFQYPTDGQYNHGVRQETITITDLNKPLLEQTWSEPQMQEYAKRAKEFHLKRLKA